MDATWPRSVPGPLLTRRNGVPDWYPFLPVSNGDRSRAPMHALTETYGRLPCRLLYRNTVSGAIRGGYETFRRWSLPGGSMLLKVGFEVL